MPPIPTYFYLYYSYYFLIMEPLAQTKHSDPQSHIWAYRKKYRPLCQCWITLPDQSNTLSSCLINHSKFNIIHICLDNNTKTWISHATPFSRAPTSSLTYLGIKLMPPSNILLRQNNNILVMKLKKYVKSSKATFASCAGCIAVSKMFLLPHIIYLFRIILLPMLPLYLCKHPKHPQSA